jgi:hypothetical protein
MLLLLYLNGTLVGYFKDWLNALNDSCHAMSGATAIDPNGGATIIQPITPLNRGELFLRFAGP